MSNACKKILVCDDEPHLREAIASSLTKGGFQVFEATDGHDCLLQLERVNPDILLIDVFMPKYSGLDVIKLMRKNYYNGHIYVLTGAFKKDLDDKIKRLGIKESDIIYKPFSISSLCQKIDKM